jgi:hypothetical protein
MPVASRPVVDGFGLGLGINLGLSGAVSVGAVLALLALRPCADSEESLLSFLGSADFSLGGLNKFLNSFGNKDKVARIMGYGARMMGGVFADAFPSPIWAPKFANMKIKMSEARSSYRFMLSVPFLVKLTGDCPWGRDASIHHGLFAVHQLGSIIWHLLDHVRWLQSLKFVRGDAKRMTKIAYGFFMIGQLAGSVHFYLALASPSSEDSSPKKTAAARKGLYKTLLNAIAYAHISQMVVSHDIICGANAVITSSMDVYDGYPRKEHAKVI